MLFFLFSARVLPKRTAKKDPAKTEVLRPSSDNVTRKEYNNQTVATQENNLKIFLKDSKKTASAQKEITKKAVTRGKRNAVIEKSTQDGFEKTNAAIEKTQIKKRPKKEQKIETAVLENENNISEDITGEDNIEEEMLNSTYEISNINNIKNILPSKDDSNSHKKQEERKDNCDMDQGKSLDSIKVISE